jgi:hypothetical protein
VLRESSDVRVGRWTSRRKRHSGRLAWHGRLHVGARRFE